MSNNYLISSNLGNIDITKIFQRWVSELSNLARMHSNNLPINLEQLEVFNFSLLLSTNQNVLMLELLKMVKDVGNTFVDEFSQYIKQIREPREYKFGCENFVINSLDSFISSATIRYISNVNAFKLVNDANIILEKYKVHKVEYNGQSLDLLYTNTMSFKSNPAAMTQLAQEASLYRSFCENMTSQGRLLNIPKLIQSIAELSDFDSTRGYKWDENPILYIMKLLLRGYHEFPFVEMGHKMRFISACSMTLPNLLYSLAQLWFNYMRLDMSKDELLVSIVGYLEKSVVSLEEWILEFKDYRIGTMKYLTEMIEIAITPIYGHLAPAAIRKTREVTEIWKNKEQEYDEFSKEFCRLAPKALVRYLVQMKVLVPDSALIIEVGSDVSWRFSQLKIFKNVDEARKLYMFLQVAGLNGLYIKAPVILTLEKSILPRASVCVGPKIHQTFSEISEGLQVPLLYNWDDNELLNEMMTELLRLSDSYKQQIDKIEFTQDFIRSLTNRSGGVDYIPTEAEMCDVDGALLKLLGRKRLFYYLFNPIIFTNFNEWMQAVRQSSSSGERKQVDRRGRVIQMVSNAGQLASFLLLSIMNVFSGKEPELISKKMSGTIRDMLPLLSGTADLFTVYEAADIKGMDAATTKVLTTFTADFVIKTLAHLTNTPYFWASPREYITYDHLTKTASTKVISAFAQVVAYSELYANTNTYLLQIPELLSDHNGKHTIHTSADAFPSGMFSTASQHNAINVSVIRVSVRRFLKKVRDKYRDSNIFVNDTPYVCDIRVRSRVSGDDILVELVCNDLTDSIAISYSNYLTQCYNEIGLQLTSSFTRFSTTFLQQTAWFGIVVPKPERLSIVTSEHGEAIKVEVLEGFAEVNDILRESSTRTHFPSHWRSIAMCFANLLRRVRIVLPTLATVKELLIKTGSSLRWFYSITEKHGVKRVSINIVFPYFTLFSSQGFKIPHVAMYYHNSYFHGLNSLATVGTYLEWHTRKILLCGKSISHVTPQVEFLIRAYLIQRIRTTYLPSGLDDATLTGEGTKLLQSMRDVIKELYDMELVRVLDLDWMVSLLSFNGLSWSKRFRLKQVPVDVRERWAKRLEHQLDFTEIQKSRISYVALAKNHFQAPLELAFYLSPRERVKQAIEAVPSGDEEFRLLRLAFLSYALESSKENHMLYLDDDLSVFSMYLFDIVPQQYSENRKELLLEESKVKLVDSVFDRIVQLLPASGRDLDYDLLIARVGYNFYETKYTFSGYYGFKPGPWKEYNHEALVKFASYVYYTKPQLMHHVWSYANIKPRDQRQLLNMIRQGDLEISLPWKSITHTRQHFNIATSYHSLQKHWPNLFRFVDQRIQGFARFIARDHTINSKEEGLCQFDIWFHPLFLLLQSKYVLTNLEKAKILKRLQTSGSGDIIHAISAVS